MKRKYKIMIGGLAVVAILVAAAATTAFAASKVVPETPATVQTATVDVTSVATPTDADYQAWGCPVANGNYEALAKLLGMTTQDIETQIEQGKSLVEIAAAKGVSEDKLVATIFAPMKEFMQQQVTSGRWTQAQMDSHLKLAEQHVRQLVNAKGDADNQGCGGGSMMSGWGGNGATPITPGGQPNNSSSYGRGGMMGGYGGTTGGYGGMMGGGYGGRTGGGYGGMMGGWY